MKSFQVKKRGFTLIEMLIAFFLAMFILSAFYLMHGQTQRRLVKMIHKARGQQAVRLFMTKLRQELKGATKVYIPTQAPGADEQNLPYSWDGQPRSDVIILMQGRSNTRDYPGFTIKYEFIKEKGAIRFSEYQNQNQLIREGIFLGGNTQILSFHAKQSDQSVQILSQKHKVDVWIGYYDIAKPGSVGGDNREVVPLEASLSVFPRPINMLLRIDVPQG